MKAGARISTLFLLLLMATTLILGSKLVYAEDLDTLNGYDSSEVTQDGSSATEQDQIQTTKKDDSMDESADAVADYLKGHSAVTSEDMAKGDKLAKPITKIIGNVIGIIMVLITALIGLVTVLDLAYIALPFTRNILNPQNQVGGGIGGMGMGGFGGMRGGMGMGGMGMGGGMSQGAAPAGKKWVSDEAVAAVMLSQSAQQQPQGGGMGMGGMGGMGMGMQQPNQAPAGGKSAIVSYFKKRVFFLIVFAVASVSLMSSIFTDCGINIAQLLYKVIGMFNGGISNVEIG